MPVEIRELVVKGTIDPEKNFQDEESQDKLDTQKLKKDIVEKCVQLIMEKLKRNERR
jgi:hypothetical protein